MSDTIGRRRAAGALVAAVLTLPGCALLETRAQYRSAAQHWESAERDAAPAAAEAPFAGAQTLERAALVAEVLRRNPSIAAARHAWRAALARYPQETALDDPMVGYMAGPRSFDSPQIRRAQRFELSQAFPFPGKLALRGAAALAEADALAGDFAAVRVRLAAMASALYDEHWLAARSLDINRAHLDLVRELRAVATSRYESGTAEQQDPLRAELEEAELLHREVELRSASRVTAQQIAQLLHRPDGAEIPPPPVELTPLDVTAADDGALEAALRERPELRAAQARVAAKQAAVRLAKREFLPDFTLSGGYDTFWELADQRPFVGIDVNVPLQIGRRRAALAQADAELAQARSEQAGVRDEVEAEIRNARERLGEARHGLAILRDRVVPAARDQISAARAGLETGRIALGDVIDAERALRNAELAERSALAQLSQRAAELLAALGRAPTVGADAAPAPPAHEELRHE